MFLFSRIKEYFQDYYAYLKEQKAEADRIQKGKDFNNGENQPIVQKQLKELIKLQEQLEGAVRQQRAKKKGVR